MKCAFVFGKTWRLSLAELLSYLDMEGIGYSFIDLSKKAMVIEASMDPEKALEALGGTLKVVKVEKEFPFDQLKAQDFGDWVDKPVSVYGSYKMLHNIRKIFKVIPKDGVMSHTELVRRKKNESAMVFGMKSTYWGPTVSVINPFEYARRDMGKPVKRPELGISPSRSRILLNLCQARENVLDPFCGIGTIGVEAIHKGIPEIFLGDCDKGVLKDARKNMSWAKRHYRSSAKVVLEHLDARRVGDKLFGIRAIATEPDLGPTLRKKAKRSDAEDIIRYLEPMYEKFMASAFHALEAGSRIAITLPCINAYGGKVFAEKQFRGYSLVDPFAAIPGKYREFLKLHGRTILDEEREKGVVRNTIREFCVYGKK